MDDVEDDDGDDGSGSDSEPSIDEDALDDDNDHNNLLGYEPEPYEVVEDVMDLPSLNELAYDECCVVTDVVMIESTIQIKCAVVDVIHVY